MASMMKQLKGKAATATEMARARSSAYYKQLLEQNKQYIVREPTVEKCQELSKQLFYTRLASHSKKSGCSQSFGFSMKVERIPEGVSLGRVGPAARGCSLPGRTQSFWRELDYVKQRLRNRRDLKLEEVAITALFLAELYALFVVGEIVGRRGSIRGYKV